ncbi:MAG: oligosaccharide MFS transporter [Sporolactobacillus sp.]|jgi:OHS family lactose permease-like MFS transporter|nr:oligosaccharide MFS transporter [Sporolactobacillus sp.]
MENIKKPVFWNFGGMYFFYFMIWQFVFTFLPYWLTGPAHLDTGESGIVFSIMAVVALFLEPIYGIIQDKLGLKKYLFVFVVLCLILIGPFVNFAFIPLLKVNTVFGAVMGGIFLSLCLNSGVGVVESYIERSSRANHFEYGHVRLFGSLAGGTASFIGGLMFVRNPFSIFWAGSVSAIILGLLLWAVRIRKLDYEKHETATEEKAYVNKENIAKVLKGKSFWGLCILIIGSACMYDVFDQQFPNYFASFFQVKSAGETFFSRVVSIQIFMEAAFMVVAPWFINKIGAKKGLILYGVILCVRILGCAFLTNIWMLTFWRLLASLEMPLMLVSIMKYITSVFDVRLSATVYMLGFNFAKQVGVTIFSYVMGRMYIMLGFHNAYIFLGLAVLMLTLFGSALMVDDKKKKMLEPSSTASS